MKMIFKKDRAHILFIIGLLLFLSAKLCMSLIPIMYRSAPVESDDAYAYILKAEQLKHGVDDSPALDDMREQLTSYSSDPGISFLRYKYYLRIINHYHPLHSILLMGFNLTGFSWEQSYAILQVLGILFICVVAAFWLYMLWGAEAAGIAMILLAFIRFPGHGINSIVPSNLSLGIAMLSWTVVMTKRNSREWIALILICAMLAMHPIARLYAIVTLVLYTMSSERPFRKKNFIYLGLGLCIIGLAFAIPWFLSIQEHTPQTKNLLGLFANIRPVVETFLKWTESFGGYACTGFLILTGYFCLSPPKRKNALLVGGVLLVLLFASIFYVLPNYPGHLFERMLVPFGIFFAGAVGKSLFEWISVAVSRFSYKIYKEKSNANDEKNIFNRLPQRTWSLILVGLISWIFLYNIGIGTAHIVHVAKTKILRQQKLLNPAQPATLLSRSNITNTVLYTGETPMFYYFAHGALQRGAVCYPTLKGTPDENIWVDKNKSIRYIVAWNPIQEGFIYLLADKELNIRSYSPLLLSSLSLFIENPGEESALIFYSKDSNIHPSEKDLRLQIPARYTGWIKCSADWKVIVSSIALKAAQHNRSMKLKGVHIDDGNKTSLSWPWDKGINIGYFRPDGERNVASFKTQELFPNSTSIIEVLSDEGFSVLAEFVHE